MKLKTKLTGIAAAVAVALPLMVPGAAFAAPPPPKCIGLANGGGMVCFTPLAGTEVAGIQIGEAGAHSLPADPQVEVAGVQFSPQLGTYASCVFDADQANSQTCIA